MYPIQMATERSSRRYAYYSSTSRLASSIVCIYIQSYYIYIKYAYYNILSINSTTINILCTT